MNLKVGKNGRAEIGPVPNKLGGVINGQLNDEATNLGQVNALIKSASASQASNTTQSTSTTTGAATYAGGVGIGKNLQVGGLLVTSQETVANHTGIVINTTGAGTLAVVTSGVIAGLITSTSAAGVTITLDSVANMITAFATAGATIGTGTQLNFIIDNSQGANTVTLAVDSGATVAVATPALTGGATLTVTTGNKIGQFSLYITSATTAILSRLI